MAGRGLRNEGQRMRDEGRRVTRNIVNFLLALRDKSDDNAIGSAGNIQPLIWPTDALYGTI